MFVGLQFPGNQSKRAVQEDAWASIVALPAAASWSGIAFNPTNSLWAAVVGNSTQGATSTDGSTWTSRTTASASYNWNGMASANGYFCTVGASSNQAQTSTDGINWTLRTMPSSQGWRISMGGANTNLPGILAFTDGDKVAYSSNGGVTWTESTLTGSPSPSVSHWQTAYNGTFWMIAESNNCGWTYVSTNGTTWTAREVTDSYDTSRPGTGDKRKFQVRGPYIKGNNFVLNVNVFGHGFIKSTDGVNWTRIRQVDAAQYPDSGGGAGGQNGGYGALNSTYYGFGVSNADVSFQIISQYTPRFNNRIIDFDTGISRHRILPLVPNQTDRTGFSYPYLERTNLAINSSGRIVGVTTATGGSSYAWYGSTTSVSARVV